MRNDGLRVTAYRCEEKAIYDDAKHFEIGDKILVGDYAATCVKKTKKGRALFIFDEYLDDARPMNQTDTNEGGWEACDLRKWLKEHEDDILGDLKQYAVPFKNGDLLRIPYAEELFGELDWVEPSGKKQWPMMTNRRNRLASRKDDEYEAGWLMNKHKNSAAYFARVSYHGNAANTGASSYFYASYSDGVRPVFRLG